MNRIYSIETSQGITTVRFSAAPGVEALKNAIDDLTDYHQSVLRLWDFSDSGLSLSNSQLEKLAEYGKRRFTMPSRVAIVAPEDFTFGLSRIYEVYREEGKLQLKVFRTELEARHWLLEKHIGSAKKRD